MKCAPLISRIVLNNEDFREDLESNEDLRIIMEEMGQEIRSWTQSSFEFDYSNLYTENRIKLNQLAEWLESFRGTNDPRKQGDLIRAIAPYTRELNQTFSDYVRQGNMIGANVSSETLKIIDPSFKDHRTIIDGTYAWGYSNKDEDLK